jgi:hypothetical protein
MIISPHQIYREAMTEREKEGMADLTANADLSLNLNP